MSIFRLLLGRRQDPDLRCRGVVIARLEPHEWPSIVAMRPKLQLSERVLVSDEFRREMNRWLAERFGYE